MPSEEGKLFVGGLNFSPDGRALEDHFSNWKTQLSQGFGFITFNSPECASDAMRALNGKSLIITTWASWPRGTRGACGCGHSYSRGGGDRDCGSDRYDNQPGGYG
ncbi:hypothetical protein K5549_020764, partial [Capra hircus]|uniref:RRM domain-containing protein n=1 Tax=Capra hircus TaxID=9925 RepID=A0A452DK90_CAPHI